jgi:hypothetical protein
MSLGEYQEPRKSPGRNGRIEGGVKQIWRLERYGVEGMDTPNVLYPEVHVSVRSRNRFALVSAIRLGLRRAGTSPAEIERFSREALSEQDTRRFEEICKAWVRLERPV